MSLRRILRPTRAIAATLGTAALLGSCSDSPTNSGNPPSGHQMTAPKLGSTFTFDTYQTDAVGHEVPGTDSTHIFTVAATGITYAGKTDVVKFVATMNGLPSDTTYLRYESNGDVSQYLAFEQAPFITRGWVTIPFSTKTKQSVKLLDSSVVDPLTNETTRITVDVETSGSDTGSVTLGAGTFSFVKGQVKALVNISRNGVSGLSGTSMADLWVAPSFGFIVKNVGTATSTLAGSTTISGQVEALTSYSLK